VIDSPQTRYVDQYVHELTEQTDSAPVTATSVHVAVGANATVPVGDVASAAEVSVTVTVHDVDSPRANAAGVQETVVIVVWRTAVVTWRVKVFELTP